VFVQVFMQALVAVRYHCSGVTAGVMFSLLVVIVHCSWHLAFSEHLFAQQSQSAPQKKTIKPEQAGIPQAPATPAKTRLSGYGQRQLLMKQSLVERVPFRLIGPTVMSGRVVDIEAYPQDPTRFYVAYASGGLWRSTTNGISLEPLFDSEAVMTIGDIAVRFHADASKDEIWIGTGENNSSRSSYSGIGLYKSADGGKTWLHITASGLDETHHIGRIILHPTDPNIVWVAAVGHLYSPNAERGVYKTTDGGKTWRKTLFVDANTGAIDLAADPQNPQNLYAALWYKTRRAWNFEESGATSGIYKSTDGGETWSLVSTRESGFPNGIGVGRIGLSVCTSKPNIVYAVLDNQFTKAKEPSDEPKIDKDTLRTMSKENFLKLDKTLLADFLRDNGFPKEYSADSVRKLVETNVIKPQTLVEYLEDANAALFDAPIQGLEVYRSDDAGKTWKRTHEKPLENVFFTYGYYFAQIRVAPFDENLLYILGVPALKSADGGKTLSSIGGDNVHVDHHALWLHPSRRGHFLLGNDGGVNITYDDGATYFKANTPAVGQFYHVTFDMAKPYNVYGGLQDNGVWTAPSTTKPSREWQASGEYPFKSIMGGDGMQTQVDPRDNATVYTGFQFGNYFRINKKTGERSSVMPKHALGERPLRFNWQTPILLSPFNPDIFTICSHKVHRSFDQGKTYRVVSADLTRGAKTGNVPFATISTFDESSLRFGLLYVGTDDGLMHCSKDGGITWERISDNLPRDVQKTVEHFWVSRIQASKHDTNVVYCALNGYRWDNFEPHVYRSSNNGKTWERLGMGVTGMLPMEPVNVIKEDPVNPNLLYVGTDHGLYISLDKGKTFMAMMGSRSHHGRAVHSGASVLPHVAVHDVAIHPRDKELIVGTHGRSLYIADVSHVQALQGTILSKPLHLFALKPLTVSPRWGRRGFGFSETLLPTATIGWYARQAGTAAIKIKGEKTGIVLRELSFNAEAGLNYLDFDCSVQDSSALAAHLASQTAAQAAAERSKDSTKAVAGKSSSEQTVPRIKRAENGSLYLPAGMYTVEIELNGVKETQPLELKDPKKSSTPSKPLPTSSDALSSSEYVPSEYAPSEDTPY
jgi:photosystem II stability/assembly factor-like uncharacterized protein